MVMLYKLLCWWCCYWWVDDNYGDIGIDHDVHDAKMDINKTKKRRRWCVYLAYIYALNDWLNFYVVIGSWMDHLFWWWLLCMVVKHEWYVYISCVMSNTFPKYIVI